MSELPSARHTAGMVLLDCDGVLVENTAFERRVTKTLIEELAATRRISAAAADALWNEELSGTRGEWRWYDYGFHCARLGLESPAIARQAHASAAHLLSEIPGARETLDALSASGYVVGIVTDATDWVVRYKLKALQITVDGPIFASDTLQSSKARRKYWTEIQQSSGDQPPLVVVDNRQENLDTSREVLHVETVRFLRHEHVTTLSRKVAPIGAHSGRAEHKRVYSHEQLRQVFRTIFPGFRLSA